MTEILIGFMYLPALAIGLLWWLIAKSWWALLLLCLFKRYAP